MRFTRHLLNYLAARPTTAKPFRLGHWLAALSDGELHQLRQLLDSYLDGNGDVSLDDMVALAVHCVLAEGAQARVELEHAQVDEWIAVLSVSSAFEAFRRRRWLVLTNALSIDPDRKACCYVTALGIQEGLAGTGVGGGARSFRAPEREAL